MNSNVYSNGSEQSQRCPSGQSTVALRDWIEARSALSALRGGGTPPPLRQQFIAASRAVGRSVQHPGEWLSEVWLLLFTMGVTGVWVRMLMAVVGFWPLY